jgi:hypothetical protein
VAGAPSRRVAPPGGHRTNTIGFYIWVWIPARMLLPSSMLKPREAKSTGSPRFHSVTSCSADSPDASSTINFSFHFRFKGVSFAITYQISRAAHRDGIVPIRPRVFMVSTLSCGLQLNVQTHTSVRKCSK